MRRGYYASRLALPGAAAEQLGQVLAELPGPDRWRADPQYRLLAFRRR